MAGGELHHLCGVEILNPTHGGISSHVVYIYMVRYLRGRYYIYIVYVPALEVATPEN